MGSCPGFLGPPFWVVRHLGTIVSFCFLASLGEGIVWEVNTETRAGPASPLWADEQAASEMKLIAELLS